MKHRLGRACVVVLGFATFSACSAPPKVSGGAGGPGGSGGPGSGGVSGGGPLGGGLMLPDAGPAGTGGQSNPMAEPPDAMTCGRQDHKLTRLPPEMLLVLDRSTTMGFAVEGSMNTRWVEVSGAIDDVVMKTGANILWGLKVFPSVSGCQVADPMEVNVAIDNYTPMSTAMKGTSPNMAAPGTPMTLALRKATQHLMARATPNPKYLVLGTDGLPNCAGGIVGADDTTATVAAIKDAHTAGFKTFVVGIATHNEGAQALAALNMMADAGGEARMNVPAGEARFFAVANRQDLATVLNNIAVRVASCTYPLDKTPPNPNEVYVKIDGKTVPKDPTNGWSYGPNMSAVVLNGTACDGVKAVMDRDLDVQIIFGCPGLVIP